MVELKTKISGISHYQEVLKTCKVGDKLKLVREPNNKFSPNAIAIYTKLNSLLGYINNTINMKLSLDMDNGLSFDCEILAITGEQRDVMGCNISIYERESKILTINDGFTKFKINGKYVTFEFKNQIITIKKEDFEKCYKHYSELEK